jgi:glycosyltransferase involved in cell wall biosynthesis
MSINLPDLSVITVVLNDKEGLLRAIDSVNRQSGLKVEHVIVDGGSTDGSARIALKNSSVFIESKQDGGIYPAMHRGALAANGEFMIFCNAGDGIFGEHFLAEAISQLRSRNAPWGFGPIVEHTERGTFSWVSADLAATPESIIARKSFVPFPSFIVNRAAYHAAGPLTPNYKIAGDFELICKLALLSSPLVFENPIALFSAGGISYTRANLAWREEIRIRNSLLDLNSTHKILEWFKYGMRVTKWRIGKILDLFERFAPWNKSWRDRRATQVPEVYRIFLPKNL